MSGGTPGASDVLAALADLAPSAEQRAGGLTVPTEWFRWLPLDGAEQLRLARGLLDQVGERQQPPAAAAGVSIDRRFGERLAAVDQVRAGERTLRLGWLFVAGRMQDADGRRRRVFHPLVTTPVRARRSLLAGPSLAPVGDAEVTELVTDGPTRAELDRRMDLGGGAFTGATSVEAAPALLRRLPRLAAFARDLAAAAGLPATELVPATAGPDTLARRDGLALVVGLAVYARHEVGTAGRAGALRAWAAAPRQTATAFDALYGLADSEADAPVPGGDGGGPGSPYLLTPVQRQAVARSRTDPITLVAGAPGTGKSHTLVAVACDALARGRRVLVAAKSDATVDALLDLLERGPGPTPVVFGSNERREALAARLAAGQLQPVPGSTVAAARAHSQQAAARRGQLRRSIVQRLEAEALLAAGDEATAPARRLAPALFAGGADGALLDEVERLITRLSAPAGGGRARRWWSRRRSRRLRRALAALTGADPAHLADRPASAAGDLGAAAAAGGSGGRFGPAGAGPGWAGSADEAGAWGDAAVSGGPGGRFGPAGAGPGWGGSGDEAWASGDTAVRGGLGGSVGPAADEAGAWDDAAVAGGLDGRSGPAGAGPGWAGSADEAGPWGDAAVPGGLGGPVGPPADDAGAWGDAAVPDGLGGRFGPAGAGPGWAGAAGETAAHPGGAGAPPVGGLAGLRWALGVARASQTAAGLRAAGGLELAGDWQRLHRLEEEARTATARWLALESRSDRRLNRSTLPAVAALATALRSGRAARRAQLERLDDRTLTLALPLWVGTLADIEDLLPPVPALFDLVVLDEASSIDQPLAAPALLRASRAVVAGDPRQLRHVSFVSDERLRAAATAHGLDADPALAARLDVRRNSTFDVAAGAAAVVTLDEHFRSDPHLVDFVARRLYDGRVHVATRSPATESKDCVTVVRVEGHRDDKGVVRAEVERVVAELRTLMRQEATSVGVVTPFRAQADAIEEAVLAALSVDELQALDLRVGTVHAFQGNERDVVVASLGLGPGDGAASWRFVEDPHLFAVFVTRARRRLTLVVSADPPAGGLVADYLAQHDAPPARPVPAGSPGPWARGVAEDLRLAGLSPVAGYPTGRHVLDVAVAIDHRDVAVECRVHPGGAEAHVERHLALLAAGWRVAEAHRSRWPDGAGELVVRLATSRP